MNRYDVAYLKMAHVFAETSMAKRKQVGCIIVKDRCIISEGVNGTIPGHPSNVCEGPDGKTLGCVIHAEDNAIRKVLRMRGSEALAGAHLYCTLAPCLECSVKIELYKIASVTYSEQYRCTKGIEHLKRIGVNVYEK